MLDAFLATAGLPGLSVKAYVIAALFLGLGWISMALLLPGWSWALHCAAVTAGDNPCDRTELMKYARYDTLLQALVAGFAGAMIALPFLFVPKDAAWYLGGRLEVWPQDEPILFCINLGLALLAVTVLLAAFSAPRGLGSAGLATLPLRLVAVLAYAFVGFMAAPLWLAFWVLGLKLQAVTFPVEVIVGQTAMIRGWLKSGYRG